MTDVVKYCEARVLSKKSKGRGGRRIDEDEHKSLWMSICIVWDDMEGLFAEKDLGNNGASKDEDRLGEKNDLQRDVGDFGDLANDSD